ASVQLSELGVLAGKKKQNQEFSHLAVETLFAFFVRRFSPKGVQITPDPCRRSDEEDLISSSFAQLANINPMIK
ncbi:hypothetical protein, partial [Chryseobacterium indoltheticum]|uniref:hypothetical protein n=1 Tax=Chryseobacterium indoltheticum TaxID=254 RepID=UPI003F494B5F